MPSAITSFTRPSGRPSLKLLASVRRCGKTMLIAGSSGQLALNGRAVSVHARCAANSRPCASIDTAPAPKLSFTNTYSLPFTSSLRIVSVCSCANSTPPSGVPTMPSAVSKSAQMISHFASAATTPGIAVTVVARSPGSSCGPCARATVDVRRHATRATVVLIARTLLHSGTHRPAIVAQTGDGALDQFHGIYDADARCSGDRRRHSESAGFSPREESSVEVVSEGQLRPHRRPHAADPPHDRLHRRQQPSTRAVGPAEVRLDLLGRRLLTASREPAD